MFCGENMKTYRFTMLISALALLCITVHAEEKKAEPKTITIMDRPFKSINLVSMENFHLLKLFES